MAYAVELRTVYGKQVWCVLDTSCMVVRTIARCDSREHATLVCTALSALAQSAQVSR